MKNIILYVNNNTEGKKRMKIMVATDFHLSYRQYGLEEREKDFYKQYKKLIKAAVKEKPDLFIQLGDIFDTPYPKPIAIKEFMEGIETLHENGIRCYGIAGNHTLVQRRNYYPIDNLFKDKMKMLNNEGMTVIDKEMDNTVYICGLNYRPRTHDIKQDIDNLYEKGKKAKVKILLLHQILKKDQWIGYDYDEEGLGLDRFDYVLLGHFHKKTTRKSGKAVIHYPGSLNSCSIPEIIDEMRYGRGYTLIDTDTGSLETVSLGGSRNYVQFNLTDDDLNEDRTSQMAALLKEYPSKPIVHLNVVMKDRKHIYETVKELEKYSLIVKTKTVSTETETETENPIQFKAEYSIDNLIREKYPEKWKADLCIGLLELLGEGKTEEAKELADKVYKQQYQ